MKHKNFENFREQAATTPKNIKEKAKFETRVDMSPIQTRHHPINIVDIPKVEICPVDLPGDEGQKPTRMKPNYTVVTKLMNLPEKRGIAYQLSNNDFGVLLNDGNKIVAKLKFDIIYCFNEHDVLEFKSSLKK